MKRIKRWVAAHTLLAAIVGSLVIAGGAAAAWAFSVGATGSGQITIATPTTPNSVTLTANGALTCTPDNSTSKMCEVDFKAWSLPSGSGPAEALSTNGSQVTATFTGQADCISHFSINPGTLTGSLTVAAGSSAGSPAFVNATNLVTVDNSLPQDCGGQVIGITITKWPTTP